MLKMIMLKISLPLLALLLSACVNQRGVSLKYNADCKEYYDLLGYYHKDCPDESFTYKEVKEGAGDAIDSFVGSKKERPKGNVW